MRKNAAELVDARGRRKIAPQTNPIVSSVRIIRRGGVRNVLLINTRENTVRVISIMKGAIVSYS